MSKIDKIVLDRQSELSAKLAVLQRTRDLAQARVDHLDREIAALTSDSVEVSQAVVEVTDLVEAGTIVSEIPVKEEPVVEVPVVDGPAEVTPTGIII